MARVYSHDRTLTLKPTIDSIQSEITSIQLAQESFASNDLAQESLSVESYDQKIFELEEVPKRQRNFAFIKWLTSFRRDRLPIG